MPKNKGEKRKRNILVKFNQNNLMNYQIQFITQDKTKIVLTNNSKKYATMTRKKKAKMRWNVTEILHYVIANLSCRFLHFAL